MARDMARDMARALLVREIGEAVQPADVAAAMQRVCNRVSASLRRSVGDDGYNALLSRALARTESDHPALTEIRRVVETRTDLDGVAAGVESHGVAAVTATVEAVLAALIDVLASLIGADMVPNLLDPERSPPHASSPEQIQ